MILDSKDYLLISFIIITIIAIIIVYFSLNNKLIKYQDDMSKNIDISDKLCITKNKVKYCLNGTDLLRINSMFPSNSQYINIVNRRPLLTERLFVNIMNAIPTLIPHLVIYSPFRNYNVPPPAINAKRMWRIYALYTDNLSGSFTIRFAVEKSNDDKTMFNMDFVLDSTCGRISGSNRDGFSSILEIPSNYKETNLNAQLYGFINPTSVNCGSTELFSGAGFTLYYLELQALDVY